ncbi:MAG: Fic family protein [Rhodoferax sp.]|uniref:Fic family protein n=1 Tax=Rhodoferax sp. TaxID=50421 RepID=UPI003267668F
MPAHLLTSIQSTPAGLTLAELLAQHPAVARRTAQRWLGQLVADGRVAAQGAGRARRYIARGARVAAAAVDRFPASIPLSADSLDVLAYVDQPLQARKPVGYQRDFLDTYQPNVTWYLSAPLRRQLHKMGHTAQADAPAGTYSRAILNRLLIDLSWASSQLEGNTYSRLDTRALIEHGQVAQGKAAMETQMILNHKTAIELLVANVEGSAGTAGFDRYTLLNLHAALAENLLPNPADEGRIRQHGVQIGKSVFRPLSVPQQVDEALALVLHKAGQIADPFEQSFFMLVHVPYLQPFADINKRTSRLAANLPLFRANLCPLTFVDVPEAAYSRAILGVYELTRVELLRDVFVWAYERSTQEYLAIKQDLAEPDPTRLAYRDVIKQTLHAVVTHPGEAALARITQAVATRVPEPDRAAVQALVVDELRRLHEGVLARYGLRPSEFVAWKAGTADALLSNK